MLLLVFAVPGCGDGGSPGIPESSTVEWQATIEPGGEALLIAPAAPLRGSRSYALVLTTEIVDDVGRALQADADFHALKGSAERDTGGPVARFDADPEAPGNPYPDPRLVRADGTIHIPDRYALRGLPDTPALAAARELARATADEVGKTPGFSTTAPIRVELSRAVDLASVTPDSLRLFELADGDAGKPWIDRILERARGAGINAEDIALAVSFPTQEIEDDLRAVRERLLERAASTGVALDLTDPDPEDDLPVGIFRRGEPGFDHFAAQEPRLAASDDVAAVGSALLSSPDFRGAPGLFDSAKVSGQVPAEPVELHVLMTVPAHAEAPYPVVITQHGFGGSNAAVLELGSRLAPYGLAAVGISAVSHGRRGNPIALLRASAVQARDIFRQTIADQMALVRAVEAGVDVDDDSRADFDAGNIEYLGISLGGILGATFVAVEDDVRVAVLNVAGGRVAFLGDSPATRAIYAADLAQRVGLSVQSPEFEVFLRRMFELGQQAFDSVDGLNFARYWLREPFSGVPRRVLLQEGIGDLWVPNENTEALAAAAGLVANVAMADPGGVSGLWRFDPPGGHSILGRDDVFAQAARFLQTTGTEIIDPEGLG